MPEFKQKKKRSRAFTLAETVVAMTVILLISASAISAIAYSSSLSRRNDNKLFFATEIDNYLECYITDGFALADTSLISFHLGAKVSTFVEPPAAEPSGVKLYKFYYNSAYKILPPNSANKSFCLSVTLDPKNGFFAEATSVSDNKKIFALKEFFKRAEDYNGGGA